MSAKKIIANLMVVFLLLSIISCNKKAIVETKIETNTNQSTNFRSEEPKDKHIIHIAWDPGRKDKGCTGFGMCNVEICGFCCTLNGVVVPCNNSNIVTNTGTIVLDESTGSGTMMYQLDENDTQENNAITNNAIFYIDNDLYIDGAVILKGEYKYNSSVGTNGGYIINVLKN